MDGSDGNRDASVAELVRTLASDVSLLLRREADLARIELKDKASQVRGAAGILAAGATSAIFAAATLIAAAVLALSLVLPPWAAALIVALFLGAVATGLVVVGRRRLRAATPLAPTRTVDTFREDVKWIRHKTDQLKMSE